MNNSYFMVFDFGTGAGKVIIFDKSGNIIAKSTRKWNYINIDDSLEFSSEEFWNKFCNCVQDIINKCKIDFNSIVSITSASQREGIVLLDEKDNVLYAGPNFDERGKKYNNELAKLYGKKIYQKTGHWPESIFLPGRLYWFKEKKPNIYKKIKKVLLLNDFILYKLTGNKYSEPTNASETLLYNIKSKNWDNELLNIMNFSSEIFCPVKNNGEIYGYLKEELACKWGLHPNVPVIVGAADTQCALLGCGLYYPGNIGIVAGSTCPIQMIIDKPLIDRKMRTWTSPYVRKNSYVLEANTGPTGLLIEWIRKSFYSNLNNTKEAFKIMEQEASCLPPGSKGVRSYIGPAISDVKDKKVLNIRHILGLPKNYFESNGRGLLVRSSLENIAFAINANINLLEEISGIKPSMCVITGGNTNNKILLKIIASLIDIPFYITTQEATALGAAMCAAVGIGYYKNLEQAIEKMQFTLKEVKRDRKLRQEYKKYFRKWKNTFNKLRGCYE